MNEFLKVSQLFSPLLLGLAFHGLCIKFGWLRALAVPIDNGLTFRGERVFGDNKTYRGLIAVGLGAALGCLLERIISLEIETSAFNELTKFSILGALAFGFAFGVAAMLSELPNSFIKRQSKIEPGAAGKGAIGSLFFFLDQVDLLIGSWVILAFILPVTIERILWSIAFLFVAHQVMTIVGYCLGMRVTPR